MNNVEECLKLAYETSTEFFVDMNHFYLKCAQFYQNEFKIIAIT